MSRRRKGKLRLAAAGVAGIMIAGTALALEAHAADSKPDSLKDREDCPQGAAIAIPNLLEARKSGNESSALPEEKARAKKSRKKAAARKKTTKKAVKKATRKRVLNKRPALKKKATKKAARRRPARRDPC